MDQLISESTIISFHAPLTSETAGIVNKDFIDRLNENTILINTARGPLISNLQDVIDGLNSRKLLFVGIDVGIDDVILLLLLSTTTTFFANDDIFNILHIINNIIF